jgi:hypothetical protein
MPLNVESDRWENANRFDPIKVKIDDLLRNNDDKAFSIKEIEEHLLDNHERVFPDDLTGETSEAGAKAARQSIVASILSRKYWKYEVEFRYYAGDDETDPGLYFKADGVGVSPIVELEEAVGYDSDSGSLSSSLANRFKEVEGEIDDEVSELEDRVEYLEFRIQEELGAY